MSESKRVRTLPKRLEDVQLNLEDLMEQPKGQKRRVYKLLVLNDIRAALKDKQLHILWPEDGKWYAADIEELDVKAGNAYVCYPETGEFEDLNLKELIAEKCIATIEVRSWRSKLRRDEFPVSEADREGVVYAEDDEEYNAQEDSDGPMSDDQHLDSDADVDDDELPGSSDDSDGGGRRGSKPRAKDVPARGPSGGTPASSKKRASADGGGSGGPKRRRSEDDSAGSEDADARNFKKAVLQRLIASKAAGASAAAAASGPAGSGPARTGSGTRTLQRLSSTSGSGLQYHGGDGDLRRKAVEQMAASLTKAAEEEAAQGHGGQLPDPRSVADGVEEALFAQFGGVNQEYKLKLRSLLFNLKDNADLRARVLHGALPAAKLVTLGADELAKRELSQWRKQREEAHAKLVVLDAEAAARFSTAAAWALRDKTLQETAQALHGEARALTPPPATLAPVPEADAEDAGEDGGDADGSLAPPVRAGSGVSEAAVLEGADSVASGLAVADAVAAAAAAGEAAPAGPSGGTIPRLASAASTAAAAMRPGPSSMLLGIDWAAIKSQALKDIPAAELQRRASQGEGEGGEQGGDSGKEGGGGADEADDDRPYDPDADEGEGHELAGPSHSQGPPVAARSQPAPGATSPAASRPPATGASTPARSGGGGPGGGEVRDLSPIVAPPPNGAPPPRTPVWAGRFTIPGGAGFSAVVELLGGGGVLGAMLGRRGGEVDIMGRVAIDKFQAFLEDLRNSRSRAVSVGVARPIPSPTHEGPDAAALRELCRAYGGKGKMGKLALTDGLEGYLIPRSELTARLAKTVRLTLPPAQAALVPPDVAPEGELLFLAVHRRDWQPPPHLMAEAVVPLVLQLAPPAAAQPTPAAPLLDPRRRAAAAAEAPAAPPPPATGAAAPAAQQGLPMAAGAHADGAAAPPSVGLDVASLASLAAALGLPAAAPAPAGAAPPGAAGVAGAAFPPGPPFAQGAPPPPPPPPRAQAAAAPAPDAATAAAAPAAGKPRRSRWDPAGAAASPARSAGGAPQSEAAASQAQSADPAAHQQLRVVDLRSLATGAAPAGAAQQPPVAHPTPAQSVAQEAQQLLAGALGLPMPPALSFEAGDGGGLAAGAPPPLGHVPLASTRAAPPQQHQQPQPQQSQSQQQQHHQQQQHVLQHMAAPSYGMVPYPHQHDPYSGGPPPQQQQPYADPHQQYADPQQHYAAPQQPHPYPSDPYAPQQHQPAGGGPTRPMMRRGGAPPGPGHYDMHPHGPPPPPPPPPGGRR